MHADHAGVFVLENEEWVPLNIAIKRDNYYVWKCHICGTYNPQGTTRCWNYKNHQDQDQEQEQEQEE